jgi:hypothetical protein
MNIFQGMSALMCLLTIAKEFGEHHFHELSGKTDIPSLGMTIVIGNALPSSGFQFWFGSKQTKTNNNFINIYG